MSDNVDDNNLRKEDDLSDLLKDSLFTLIGYSVLAATIYFVGTFSWWLGIVLFAYFVFTVVSRLIVTGFLAMVEGFVALVLFSSIRARGLNPKNFDDAKNTGLALVWINILIGFTETFILLITALLGWFFFSGIGG